MKSKFLIALPSFKNTKGFCHKTILVSAESKMDAIQLVRTLRPNSNIGEIKEFNNGHKKH